MRQFKFAVKCVVIYAIQFGVVSQLGIFSFVHAADVPTTQMIEKLMLQRSAQARKAKLLDLYESLFENASMKQLTSLEEHQNAGIALRAAWEKVRRTMSEEQKSAAKKINESALQRFIGFVEGRLGRRVPGFWRRDLLDSRYWSRRILFTGKPLTREDFAVAPSDVASATIAGISVRSMHDAVIAAAKNSLIVRLDDVTCGIPVALFKQAAETTGEPVLLDVAGAPSDRLIVALYSNFAKSFSLYCLNCKKGTKAWEAEVWCEAPMLGGATGLHVSEVALVVVKGTIYVFGMCTHSAYVEAFSTETGANLFRFSTSI